jgi:hypothetical protein
MRTSFVAVTKPKRLAESTGLEAKTIHRTLETDPRTGGFRRNEDAPLDCDLLVVDETSMVDVLLMRAVLRALPTQAALLLIARLIVSDAIVAAIGNAAGTATKLGPATVKGYTEPVNIWRLD